MESKRNGDFQGFFCQWEGKRAYIVNMEKKEKNFIGVEKDGAEIMYDNCESDLITYKYGNPIVPKKFLKCWRLNGNGKTKKANHLGLEGLNMNSRKSYVKKG